ncbi:MAG: type II toxin-antitoxin system prevent-host-death family antitoxin [Actinomycetes bacterium]
MTSLPDELPISEARDHLTEVVARATYGGQITYVTKRGRRVGAIVPVEVAEAAEAAEDEYLSGLARDAEAELATGAPARPLAEVLGDLDLGHIDDTAGEDEPDPPIVRQRSEPPSFAPEPRRRP